MSAILQKKFVDKRNEKAESDFVPQTNEKHVSVTCDCKELIDSFQCLSSSLDSLVKTLVDINDKTLKNLKKENAAGDSILVIVNDIETLISDEKRYEIFIGDFKKDFKEEVQKLEEALINFISENDFRIFINRNFW